MSQLTDIPQVVYDAYLNWGNDLTLSSGGDLLLTDGPTVLSEQRIIRRLMTSPPDYIWSPSYGAGIPAFVGQTLSSDAYENIQAAILSNMFLENSVSQTPPPIISFQTIQSGLFTSIAYNLSPSSQPIVINFEVNLT